MPTSSIKSHYTINQSKGVGNKNTNNNPQDFSTTSTTQNLSMLGTFIVLNEKEYTIRSKGGGILTLLVVVQRIESVGYTFYLTSISSMTSDVTLKSLGINVVHMNSSFIPFRPSPWGGRGSSYV